MTIENTFAVTSGEIPRLKEMFIEERVTRDTIDIGGRIQNK